MYLWLYVKLVFFFFNDTATTEIYTLSLHDALPISEGVLAQGESGVAQKRHGLGAGAERSEEHTSELQSQSNLVCRLLLEKKKKNEPHQNNEANTTHKQHTTRAEHINVIQQLEGPAT